MKKTVIFSTLLCLCAVSLLRAQGTDAVNAQHAQKMQWWNEAKFGMFIHWGIYSVPAGTWGDNHGYGEWFMHSTKMPRAKYAQFAKQFNPVRFNAEEWVQLAKAAGQKYIIITSKHHDGFAMFGSKVSNYNIVDATPFQRDVLKELADACRKYDMKLGFYYSQAQDWYHPGGTVQNGDWDPTHKGDMMKYITEVSLPQVKELLSNYGDVAVLWWDAPVDMTTEAADTLKSILKDYPNLITNDRLWWKEGYKGDHLTAEQCVPPTGYPGHYWESCITMNEHWGYCSHDENWKSSTEVLRQLIDVVSKGGNMLLNVGPTSEGVIPEVCQHALLEVGDWLRVNGEAIYDADPSPLPWLGWGRATRKDQILYLHIFDWPADGLLRIPLLNEVTSARLLADKNNLLKVSQVDGGVVVHLPHNAPDKMASVLRIKFKGEPKALPIPSQGKSVKVSSTKPGFDAANMTDGDPLTTWRAAETHATVEMDLGEPVAVQYLGIASPWPGWAHVIQHTVLQANVNGEWTTLFDADLPGYGSVERIPLTTAQHFRLILDNSNNPGLEEFILYRGETVGTPAPEVASGPSNSRADTHSNRGWTNTLQKMNLDIDVAFFGDSMTYLYNFQSAFPNVSVCNLGYPGDDLTGMLIRVPQLAAIHAKKVFLMGGINGMQWFTPESFREKYTALVDSITRALPNAEIYLQSVLPVCEARSPWGQKNANIVEANDIIRQIAKQYHCKYVNLYSSFEKDGGMNPDLVGKDGLHLLPDSYSLWINKIKKYVKK